MSGVEHAPDGCVACRLGFDDQQMAFLAHAITGGWIMRGRAVDGGGRLPTQAELSAAIQMAAAVWNQNHPPESGEVRAHAAEHADDGPLPDGVLGRVLVRNADGQMVAHVQTRSVSLANSIAETLESAARFLRESGPTGWVPRR